MKGSLQPGAQERFAAAKRLLEQEFQDREGEDAKMRTTTYNAGLSSSVNSGLAAETVRANRRRPLARAASQSRLQSSAGSSTQLDPPFACGSAAT